MSGAPEPRPEPARAGRMRIGFNTNGLQSHRLDDALVLLHEHGYEAVALTPDVMHLDPLRCTRDEVRRIARLVRELSLEVVIETGARFLLDPRTKHEPTLMTRDPELLQRRLELYERCAQIGAELGAKVLSFWSGIERAPDVGSFEWLCEGVRKTCALARRHGLVPALEPEPGMAVPTVREYRRVHEALGADAPRLCLDVGHLYVIDEGDPCDVITSSAPFLAAVQLEDMKRGVHEHLVPGEGDVDFARVRAALAACGYAGTVCFEISRGSHKAPETLARCRALFPRG